MVFTLKKKRNNKDSMGKVIYNVLAVKDPEMVRKLRQESWISLHSSEQVLYNSAWQNSYQLMQSRNKCVGLYRKWIPERPVVLREQGVVPRTKDSDAVYGVGSASRCCIG